MASGRRVSTTNPPDPGDSSLRSEQQTGVCHREDRRSLAAANPPLCSPLNIRGARGVITGAKPPALPSSQPDLPPSIASPDISTLVIARPDISTLVIARPDGVGPWRSRPPHSPFTVYHSLLTIPAPFSPPPARRASTADRYCSDGPPDVFAAMGDVESDQRKW